jgi:Xaa-Pro aminopeptidase
MTAAATDALLIAGIPALNMSLYRQIRFLVGDPTAYLQWKDATGQVQSILILRDIEMERAKKTARASTVASPRDYIPEGGLSGDRETATAQAVAECFRRAGIRTVRSDRSLPLIYAEMARRAGIDVQCDTEMGVLERRCKDEQEIAWMQEAQAATEGAMEMACRLVAHAQARSDGALEVDGEPLTSEIVRWRIDQWLLQRGYSNPESIVAGGAIGADCHDHGHGQLRTGEPVIIDIFPRNRKTLYNGDCTRTVVHGEIPAVLQKMHAAVVAAKQAATAAVRPGVTGQQVHEATIEAMKSHGYPMGLPPQGAAAGYCSMTHGTGHGLGLEVHEPPLLDKGGPALIVGDCLTIEPGLYAVGIGGIRVEDMIVVTPEGCINLNRLPEGLDWT